MKEFFLNVMSGFHFFFPLHSFILFLFQFSFTYGFNRNIPQYFMRLFLHIEMIWYQRTIVYLVWLLYFRFFFFLFFYFYFNFCWIRIYILPFVLNMNEIMWGFFYASTIFINRLLIHFFFTCCQWDWSFLFFILLPFIPAAAAGKCFKKTKKKNISSIFTDILCRRLLVKVHMRTCMHTKKNNRINNPLKRERKKSKYWPFQINEK